MEPLTPLNEQTQASTPAPTPAPKDNKELVVILLLIFFYPLGLILMFAWTKWPKWLKITVLLLGVLPIILLLIMSGIVISSINPAKQMDRAKLSAMQASVQSACSTVNYCMSARLADISKCSSEDKLAEFMMPQKANSTLPKVNISYSGTAVTAAASLKLSNGKTCTYSCIVTDPSRKISSNELIKSADCL